MRPTVRVDWRASLGYTGRAITWLAVTLAFPLGIALLTGEDFLAFAATTLVALAVAGLLQRFGAKRELAIREAMLMVAFTWLLAAGIGALPYVFAGEGTVARPVNAFFESMSGFTTTGATVMADVSIAAHSPAVMIWRQLTQWLGGMGIVVLAVALLPEISVGGFKLVSAEAPGPEVQKLTPRIAETARRLWKIYAGITLLEVSALYALHLLGLAPKMTLYSAVAHAFTTMATGGFSPQAQSIAAFSAAVQWVIVPFMLAAGINFALFTRVREEGLSLFQSDPEFRFYLGTLGIVAVLTFLLTFAGASGTPLLDGVRHAVFQAVSIVTTTGFASANFIEWPLSAQYLLILAMFLGGSAGSTASAVKMVRWLVILKTLRQALVVTAHPAALEPVRVGGQLVDKSKIRSIHAFTLLYLVLFAVGSMVVMANGTVGGQTLSIAEAMSATAATLGNVGPGIGLVGPMRNYLVLPTGTKLLLVALMWLGRLEILTVLVLFTNAYWRV